MFGLLLLLALAGFQFAFVGVVDPALADLPFAPAGVPDAAASDAAAQLDEHLRAIESLPLRRAANALPLFALLLVLLAVTRRPLLSLWLTSLLTLALYVVDRLKFDVLHAHLLPADALLVPQMLATGMFRHYVRLDGGGWAVALALVVVTAVFCMEPAWRCLRTGLRIALLGFAMALSVAIAGAAANASGWYSNERLGFQPWTPEASVEHAGLVASLVRLSADTQWTTPKADELFVQHVLDLHQHDADGAVEGLRPDSGGMRRDLADGLAPEASALDPVGDRSRAAAAGTGLPDIVIWQSESFFEPARLRARMGSGADLPQLARLRSRSLHGQLQVPTYAGGTVRTEFEALTGYPLRAFHGVSFPYSALAQRPLMSLPRLLRERGYATLAIHPYDGGFWNRTRAFEHMGFDRFVDRDAFDAGDQHGYYIGDDALLRYVVAALDDPPDAPLFLFAISMENHGPWYERPGLDAGRLAKIPVPDGLSPHAATQLRHYLYHLHRGDAMLGELIRYVAARERHTVVLFYGDHLPGLDIAFGELAFRDGADPWDQPVPFALYDNRAPAGSKAQGTLRSYHLASLVLDTAGIRDGGHFRVLSADRERLGRTGLPAPAIDPVLDYDHALAHLSWHAYGQVPDNNDPGTDPAEPVRLQRESADTATPVRMR